MKPTSKTYSMAKTYFDRIGDGHRFAISRPLDPNVDRVFRKMVERANRNGDCIIPRQNGEGYYRPMPNDEVDALEFSNYIREQTAKVKTERLKIACMLLTYDIKQGEVATNE